MDFKKINIAILFLMITTSWVFADEAKFSDYNSSFGLKASNISGYGFYYNRRINNDFNIQAMGLIYYLFNQKEKEEYTNFNYDLGLEIQRNMFRDYNSRAYLLAGAFYYYDDVLDKSEQNSSTVVNNSFNVGVGIGYEYYYKRFVLSMDLGYKFFEDNKEITKNNSPTYPAMERTTRIGAGIGLGFTF